MAFAGRASTSELGDHLLLPAFDFVSCLPPALADLAVGKRRLPEHPSRRHLPCYFEVKSYRRASARSRSCVPGPELTPCCDLNYFADRLSPCFGDLKSLKGTWTFELDSGSATTYR